MKKILLLVLSLILFVALLACALIYDRMSNQSLEQYATAPAYTRPTGTSDTTEDTEPEPTEEDDDMAPEFQIYDAEGKAYALKDFEGKPVVICFWSDTDVASTKDLPLFEAAYKEKGTEYQFLMISTANTPETQKAALDFAAKQNYTFPVYFDTDGTTAENYELESLPTSFYISKEGLAIAFARGNITQETLQRGMEMSVAQ